MGKAKRLAYAVGDAAANIGEGLFAYATDVALWITIFSAELALPQSTSGQIGRAKRAADRFLNEWNYETIRNAIANARRQRLLRPVKRGRQAMPEITDAGKRRLAAILPVYDEKRAWDGRMHLVTYDVPEAKHTHRDLLRETLRRLGAGMLQESVWITPYNPIDALRKTIEERSLTGSVIVSDMGRDGAIGEEDSKSLVVRVWRLDKLNDRYTEWLQQANRSNGINRWLVTGYLAILKDDPQLPFPLLPKWWKGDDAYHLIAPKLKELYLMLRP